jgi:hypothetical protein
MKVLAGSLLIALLPLAAFAQAADEKTAPDLEIVKFEISVKRAPNLEESPVPRADPGSIAQRQADFNVSGPPEDSMGIGSTSPRGGANTNGRKTDRPPTDTTTPRYDRTGQITQSSDAYWPTNGEDNKSPYNFYASLTVKNTGAKAIKNIRWDYVLTDPATQKEIKRHNFRGKKALKPGESLTLTEMVRPSGAKRSVEIIRIEYADGSAWQRP